MQQKYKGNEIGTSKTQGIVELKTDLRNLRYADYPTYSEPYVYKDLDAEGKLRNDTWFEKYKQTGEVLVSRRTEDTIRIAKWIASAKGILWEGRMAGLQTIQNDLTSQTLKTYKSVQEDGSKYQYDGNGGNHSESAWSWSQVLNILKQAGKSIFQGIGLTASTLAQTAASGTGYHGHTYLSRAYLSDGGGTVLGKLLAATGIGNGGGYLDGASKAKQGKEIIGDQPWTHLTDERKLVPGDGDTTLSQGSQYYGVANDLTGPSRKGSKRTDLSLEGAEVQTPNILAGIDRILNSIQNGTSVVDAVTTTPLFSRNINHNQPNTPTVDVLHTVRERDEAYLSGRYGKTQDLSPAVDYHNLPTHKETVAKIFDDESQRYVQNPSVVRSWNRDAEANPQKSRSKSGGSMTFSPVKALQTGSRTSVHGEGYGYVKPDYNAGSAVQSRKTFGNTLTTGSLKDTFYINGLSKHGNAGGKVRNFSEDHLNYNSEFEETALSLIPFCITTITPDHRTYINFPAHLDSYDDSYTGNWDSAKYIGRAEPFWGYTGFTRSINFAFKVAARKSSELEELYRRLNRLAGATAPSYDNTGLFMRGTLASLTIGDLLRNQTGFVNSVRLSWKQDYLWELTRNEGAGLYRIPHVLDVSVQFTPIEHGNVLEDYGAYFVFPPVERHYEAPKIESEQALEAVKKEEERERVILDESMLGPLQSPAEHTAVWTNGNVPGGGGGYGSDYRITPGEVITGVRGALDRIELSADQQADLDNKINTVLGYGGSITSGSGAGFRSGGPGGGLR